KGQQVKQVFPYDAKLEDDTLDAYNQFLNVCRENGDSISVKLFETIIDEEQAHFNYFDNVNGHLENLGDTYLARIAGTPADTGPASKGFVTQNAA
ncbi:MAG TPA: ferritin-like domain-containing protein, partial [Candidatus Rifleibacterium sp.]|nr:ferritin-like domain-containing protein [Candidatus Rifleibacterium sp.]